MQPQLGKEAVLRFCSNFGIRGAGQEVVAWAVLRLYTDEVRVAADSLAGLRTCGDQSASCINRNVFGQRCTSQRLCARP